MKKTAFFIVCAFVFLTIQAPFFPVAASNGGFKSTTSVAGGGFSGPSNVPLVSVEQAKSMRDDMHVVLRGNIVQHLGKKKYLFKDETGTITVEIHKDKWRGQTVTPETAVELRGEVDKDWNSVEIDVDEIILIQ